MTDREKLIDLLCHIPGAEEIADFFIANGVTFATDNNVGNKWIPVSERLPEHSEIALCRLTFNEFRILQWDSVSKWWLGYGAGDDWRQNDVTHWMPLPEPPKEE